MAMAGEEMMAPREMWILTTQRDDGSANALILFIIALGSLCLSYFCYEQSVPAAYPIFSRFQLGKRDVQTETKPADLTNEDSKLENHEADSLKPSADSDEQPSQPDNSKIVQFKMNAEYNFKTSPRHDLCLVFTCTVCNARSMKTANKDAYEKGVVVARCNGCNNLHLIADHLGMFGEKWTLEGFLAARGEDVKAATTDALNLTIEDLAGKDLYGKIKDFAEGDSAENKAENA